MAYNNVSGIEVMSCSPWNTTGDTDHHVFLVIVLDRSQEYNGEKGTTTVGQDQQHKVGIKIPLSVYHRQTEGTRTSSGTPCAGF
jgi:hypothetical protein